MLRSSLHKVMLLAILVLAFNFSFGKTNMSQSSAVKNTTALFIPNIGQFAIQQQQVKPDLESSISLNNGLRVLIGKGQLNYQWAKQTSHHPNQLQYGGAIMLNLQENGSLRAINHMSSIGEHASWVYTQEGRAIGSRFVFIPNIICHV